MAAEKLKVVRYAEAHGNRAAGREFDGISEANVRLLWTLPALPCLLMLMFTFCHLKLTVSNI